jgi:predicted AlkP superfamily phosphohydrolase/phosphomutase
VIDRYVQYVDERLSRILSLYAVTPNVVVVSDHGHGASTTVVSNWRGWHTKEGIFLAAGPDIARNSKSIRASYYDVLPTLAGLKGFRVNGPAGHTVVTGPTGVESPAGTLLEGTF